MNKLDAIKNAFPLLLNLYQQSNVLAPPFNQSTMKRLKTHESNICKHRRLSAKQFRPAAWFILIDSF